MTPRRRNGNRDNPCTQTPKKRRNKLEARRKQQHGSFARCRQRLKFAADRLGSCTQLREAQAILAPAAIANEAKSELISQRVRSSSQQVHQRGFGRLDGLSVGNVSHRRDLSQDLFHSLLTTTRHLSAGGDSKKASGRTGSIPEHLRRQERSKIRRKRRESPAADGCYLESIAIRRPVPILITKSQTGKTSDLGAIASSLANEKNGWLARILRETPHFCQDRIDIGLELGSSLRDRRPDGDEWNDGGADGRSRGR